MKPVIHRLGARPPFARVARRFNAEQARLRLVEMRIRGATAVSAGEPAVWAGLCIEVAAVPPESAGAVAGAAAVVLWVAEAMPQARVLLHVADRLELRVIGPEPEMLTPKLADLADRLRLLDRAEAPTV